MFEQKDKLMKLTIKKLLDGMKTHNIREFLVGLRDSSIQDIEYIDEKTGYNIIHQCVQEDAAKELLLLIGYHTALNLDIKSQGLVSRTPLELAMSLGHKKVCKVLMDKGMTVSSEFFRETRKNFQDDTMFVSYMDDSIKKTEKKRKSFFSFAH